RVAGDRLLAVGPDHHRVEVGALIGEDAEVVEAAGQGAFGTAQVPLAVQRRLVAALLQHLGEGAHPVVELGVDRGGAVDVGVRAGEDRGARGGADGVRAVGGVHPGALGGEAVHVRGRVDPAAVGGDGVGGVVVAHDEHDVGAGHG